MQTYSIIIVNDAKRDLDDIWLYVAINDLPEKANDLNDTLMETCYSLCYMPERGRRVDELESIGFFGFREIIHRPYRIIYQFINSTVVIHRIIDGRRNLKEFLQKKFDLRIGTESS